MNDTSPQLKFYNVSADPVTEVSRPLTHTPYGVIMYDADRQKKPNIESEFKYTVVLIPFRTVSVLHHCVVSQSRPTTSRFTRYIHASVWHDCTYCAQLCLTYNVTRIVCACADGYSTTDEGRTCVASDTAHEPQFIYSSGDRFEPDRVDVSQHSLQ